VTSQLNGPDRPSIILHAISDLPYLTVEAFHYNIVNQCNHYLVCHRIIWKMHCTAQNLKLIK